MKHIGESIRELRTIIGLSQRDAAEQLGVTNVHLCNVEAGKAVPSNGFIEKIESMWGVNAYVFYWCESGNADRLPMSLRDTAKQLTMLWRESVRKKVAQHQN